MTPITESTSVKISENILSKTVRGEEVVLNLSSGTYFGLETVGAFIWDKLKESPTVANLTEEVLASFDIDPKTARADVVAFLQDLHSNGLIEPA